MENKIGKHLNRGAFFISNSFTKTFEISNFANIYLTKTIVSKSL
jgi:hypothetical protein